MVLSFKILVCFIQTSPSDSGSEDELEVERILDKKIDPIDGMTRYLLKWTDYGESENSWEPIANLGCPKLIAQFEASQKNPTERKGKRQQQQRMEKSVRPRAAKNTHQTVNKLAVNNKAEVEYKLGYTTGGVYKYAPKHLGFSRGLPAEKILGSTDAGGKLQYLMQWKGTNQCDLVGADEASYKCPSVVGDYFLDRLLNMNNLNLRR